MMSSEEAQSKTVVSETPDTPKPDHHSPPSAEESSSVEDSAAEESARTPSSTGDTSDRNATDADVSQGGSEATPDQSTANQSTPDPFHTEPSSESADSRNTATSDSSAENTQTPKRRVRLNPSVHPDQAKPRPSLDPVQTGSSAAASDTGQQQQPQDASGQTSSGEGKPASPEGETNTATAQPPETPEATSPPTDTGTTSAPDTASQTAGQETTQFASAAATAPPAADQPQSDQPQSEHAQSEHAQSEHAQSGGAESATDAKSAETSDAQATAAASAQPVEIPSADDELDADTEAELAAALESGALDASTTAPASVAQPDDDEEAPPPSEEELEKGTRLKGKIQSIHGDDVFLDVGYRSPGVVQLRQFAAGKKPLVGQLIETVVERFDPAEGLILLNLPRGLRRASGNWDAIAAGQTVDCMVSKTNKGGLEVTVGGLRGFMPASQVDLGFVSDLESFVGKKLRAQVTEVNPKKRKLILSRRAHLQAERREQAEELWNTLEVGQTRDGTVKTIKKYGAFIDLGGVDGFLHIGEISHAHIRHPSDVLSEGQEVAVQILSLDREKEKIGLGMKQLIEDPWKSVTSNYPVDSIVTGHVTRITDFGAFVKLEPGVEGLVHISEVDHKRIRRVADVLKEGQEIETKVLEVDPDRHRISLSIKALKDRPEAERDLTSDDKPRPKRKRSEPLKGGTSDTVNPSGGLFGDPSDFE